MGSVQGRQSEYFSNVREFLNIPFAETPTGNLRFHSPVEMGKWKSEVIDGRNYGPVCISEGPENTNENSVSAVYNVYF